MAETSYGAADRTGRRGYEPKHEVNTAPAVTQKIRNSGVIANEKLTIGETAEVRVVSSGQRVPRVVARRRGSGEKGERACVNMAEGGVCRKIGGVPWKDFRGQRVRFESGGKRRDRKSKVG